MKHRVIVAASTLLLSLAPRAAFAACADLAQLVLPTTTITSAAVVAAGTFKTAGPPATQAALFLGQIEPVFPGLSGHFNGRATVDFWRGDAFTRGSYSYWQVGQYTRFAGIEGVQEGNAHFCGEHTSIDSQGYLNGAVETGERVAKEITANLRV